MSGARTMVFLRELTRQSPRLLLDMKSNPKSVKAVAAQTVDGKALPARIRTLDGDPIQGDSNYDLLLGDWRAVGGARIPHALTYQLNGRDILVIKYEPVTVNPALGADLFEIPAAGQGQARAPGGTHEAPIDRPTVGGSVSGVWAVGRYDGGCEGVVEKFRASISERDWRVCLSTP